MCTEGKATGWYVLGCFLSATMPKDLFTVNILIPYLLSLFHLQISIH